MAMGPMALGDLVGLELFWKQLAREKNIYIYGEI
jgi:3-hydroxyacyl-CoA dehydrogenase